MKKMVLTGLGSEQRFDAPKTEGETFSPQDTVFYMVFNGGELRVPVSEEAAHIIVKFMYGEAPQVESQEPMGVEEEESSTPSNGHRFASDEPSGMGTDEDGIDQV